MRRGARCPHLNKDAANPRVLRPGGDDLPALAGPLERAAAAPAFSIPSIIAPVKSSLRWILCVLLVAVSQAATADVFTDLRDSVHRVFQAIVAHSSGQNADANLEREAAALTRIIETGGLNGAGLSVAHFWRGQAQTTMNWSRIRRELPVDKEAARTSLGDFDKTIELGVDIPDWHVSHAEALYLAGTVARNHVEDSRLAYQYWEKCAALRHAGCLNIMASARLTGAGGIAVDLAESIRLNEEVYQTGTDFRCAGAHSALVIAQTVHFTGAQGRAVDDLGWLRRANELLDELARDGTSDDLCGRSMFEVTEYLFRLSAGEDRKEVLTPATPRRAGNAYKPLVDYLRGTLSPEAFRSALAGVSIKHVACRMNFAAAWHASLRKDAALAESYRAALGQFGADHCAIERALLNLAKR